MGLLLGHHINTPAGVAGVVTVSGENVLDIAINRAGRATIVVRDDGTIDKIENTTVTQVDTSTDWIIPNSAAPSDFETRYTGLIGDALDSSTSAAEDVWRALSLGDFFFEQRAPNDGDDFDSTITIEVRKGTGSVLDSASFRLETSRADI